MGGDEENSGRQTGRRKRRAEVELEEKSAEEENKSQDKVYTALSLSKADQKDYEVQIALWEVQFRDEGFAKCSLCYGRRRYMESMLVHYKKCASKKPDGHTCHHCQREFQSLAGLKYHLLSAHYETPLSHLNSDNSATDSTELNPAELKMILKQMGKLTCRTKGCSKTFTTFQGFIYHQKICGKEAEEFICEICEKVYHSKPGLAYHMKSTHGPPPEEVIPSENADETEPGSERVKRKAAKRAIDNLQNITKELYDNEHSSRAGDALTAKIKTLYRTPSVMPSSQMGEKCRLAIEKGEEVKCPWEGCNQMFKSWSLFRSHYTMCYKNPDADDGLFLCLVCGKKMSLQKSIRAHIIKLHKQKLRNVSRDADADVEAYPEDEDDEDDTDYDEDSEDDEDYEDYEGDDRMNTSTTSPGIRDGATARIERCQRGIKRISKSHISHFMKLAYNERKRRFSLSDGQTHSGQEIAVDWSSWKCLSPSESKQYLPEVERSIRFTVGSGWADREPSSLALFETLTSQPERESSLNFYVGGPVWSLAWCPRPPSQVAVTEYAAISCHRSFDECHYISRMYTQRGAIQLWAFDHLQQLDREEPSCRLVCCLAHEYGCIWDMKWCPSGCWQNQTSTTYKRYDFDNLHDMTNTSSHHHTAPDNSKKEKMSVDTSRDQQAVTDTSSKQEMVTDTSKEQETEAADTSKQQETAADTSKEQESTAESRQQETAADTSKQQETAADTSKEQETAADTSKQQETAAECRQQETAEYTSSKQETDADTNVKQPSAADTSMQQDTPADTSRQQETTECSNSRQHHTNTSRQQQTASDTSRDQQAPADTNRIGVLALACSDGTVRILNIPSSEYIQQLRNGTESPSVFSLQPSLTLWPGLDPSGKVSASFGQCWCVDWVPDNGHTKIAAGFTNGCIAIWDVTCRSALLRVQPDDLLPFLVFEAHDARVLKLSWCSFDSNYLATVSTDRQVKIWDLRAPAEPVVAYAHGLCTDCVWLDYSCGLAVTSEVMSRALNRGTCFCTGSASDNSRIIFSNSSCTDWCVNSSDWLHSLLIGNDSGNVSLCLLPQLTNFDAMKRNEHMGRKWHVYSSYLNELESSAENVSKEPNPDAAVTPMSCDTVTSLAPSLGADMHVDSGLTGILRDTQTDDENLTGARKSASIDGNCLTSVNHTTSINTQTNGDIETGIHHKSHSNGHILTGAPHNTQNEGNNLTGTNHCTQTEGEDFTGIHQDTHEGVAECTEVLPSQEPCCQVGRQNSPSNQTKTADNAASGHDAEVHPEFQNFDLELSDLLKTCTDVENMIQGSSLQEENVQSVSDREACDYESKQEGNVASSVSHETDGPQLHHEGDVRLATSDEANGPQIPQKGIVSLTMSSEKHEIASESTRSEMHDHLRTTRDDKDDIKADEDEESPEQQVEVTWGTSKTFREYMEKVYISFYDSVMDDFGNSEWKEKSLQTSGSSMITSMSKQRSVLAIHKACYNPNLGTHTWLLSGGQAGIMRLHCIDALKLPKTTNALASQGTQE